MYPETINYEVTTIIAKDRTIIMGDVGQVRVDEDMNVIILLKD